MGGLTRQSGENEGRNGGVRIGVGEEERDGLGMVCGVRRGEKRAERGEGCGGGRGSGGRNRGMLQKNRAKTGGGEAGLL